jgi:thiamine-phosphate pyrophosphorylase
MSEPESKNPPPCGLYLCIAENPDMDKVLLALRQAAMVINRSAFDRNMHVVELAAGPEGQGAGQGTGREKTEALVQIVKMEGLVAIIKGDAQAAKDMQADGVLLADANAIAPARALLGEEAIIGLACGQDKALAQKAHERGADYVSFGDAQVFAPIALLNWWSTLSQAPALASGNLTNDDVAAYLAAGATFLDCSDYVWNHPKGVMQGTVNMLYAIELAAGAGNRRAN